MLQYYKACQRSGMAPGMRQRPEQATAMRRLRSRSKWGSWLALFALALQLVLTFGHVHLDRLAPRITQRTSSPSLPQMRRVLTQVTPADPGGRDHRADDRCPICTLIHLAGALVLAEPPSLPLPDLSGSLPSEPPLAFDFPSSATRAVRRARTSHRLTSIWCRHALARATAVPTPSRFCFAVMRDVQ